MLLVEGLQLEHGPGPDQPSTPQRTAGTTCGLANEARSPAIGSSAVAAGVQALGLDVSLAVKQSENEDPDLGILDRGACTQRRWLQPPLFSLARTAWRAE